MELSQGQKELFIETAETLKGYARRHFMAEVVETFLDGSPMRAERELGWNRKTLRKALEEKEGGFCYIDRFHERGRKKAEEHLPDLLDDIRQIADEYSQTDPTFQTTRLYTRLTAREVRNQLIERMGYSDEELPCEETIRLKLNALGYRLKPVKKSEPLKKIPETDAIFEQMRKVNREADADETVLRISWDAKATVLIARFSRQGLSRVVVKGLDHDFHTQADKVTPFGIYLPQQGELYLYFTQSKVTSDFIVDCLCDFWLSQQERFPQVRTLVINQDNGPENNTRRTQFMQRLTAFVDQFQISVQLACYPPYHSKYNPIERVWGALEKHWNGSLLDSLHAVLSFAQSLAFKGHKPVVELVTKTYQAGVKLTQTQMKCLERRFKRLVGLEKWFVHISPLLSHSTDNYFLGLALSLQNVRERTLNEVADALHDQVLPDLSGIYYALAAARSRIASEARTKAISDDLENLAERVDNITRGTRTIMDGAKPIDWQHTDLTNELEALLEIVTIFLYKFGGFQLFPANRSGFNSGKTLQTVPFQTNQQVRRILLLT